jgi:hypothetical protein
VVFIDTAARSLFMKSKSCPHGHGTLELTHENEKERTYKCHAPECKYTASEKTPLGWALEVIPPVLGIVGLLIGIGKGKKPPTK